MKSDNNENINEKNVILEPVSRNTAPCIGLVSTYIQKRYEGEEYFEEESKNGRIAN